MEDHSLCAQTFHQQQIPILEPTPPHHDKEMDSPPSQDDLAHNIDDTASSSAVDNSQSGFTHGFTLLQTDQTQPPVATETPTPMTFLAHDFIQDTTDDQSPPKHTTHDDINEGPLLIWDGDNVAGVIGLDSTERNELVSISGACDFGGNDGVDSIDPKHQPTSNEVVEERRGSVTLDDDDDDGERHPNLNQQVDLAAIFDRLDTSTTPSSMIATPSSEQDNHQNDALNPPFYLDDTAIRLLDASTSITTTTADTQTDAYYYLDHSPRTRYSIDDNDQQQQQQQHDSSSIVSTSISATPTSSYQINVEDQSLNRTTTVGSDERTLSEPVGPRHEWESDRQASECRRCGRRFNFLIRRHHCRRCGQIVCDRCSSHRVRLPVEEIVEDPLISTSHYPIIALNPQRVCEACIRIPIKADPISIAHSSSVQDNLGGNSANGSNQRHLSMNMRRSDSQQSLMVECPVCGSGLLGMRKEQQEYHLNQCLNTGSPVIRPPRYIIYTLMEGVSQVGDECPICFEEFQVGNKIARMVCLCSYHQRCLREWLDRGKGCPIHYDSNIGTY
ncbi:unnamed protein product [Absidia cylindrospora]